MQRKTQDDVADGSTVCWRLWRHCLCRSGWYPIFIAPLVTCACLLDLYSSTGCDFIRYDIGFDPINNVWSSSRAQFGLFSFESNQGGQNRLPGFNEGCSAYSESFETTFIATDQSWPISRICAYISGISGLLATAVCWLLTITPIPASFFWPGVLLPSVIMAMLSGCGKFLMFDADICYDEIWLHSQGSTPVAARSCEIGESSVFGLAAVTAFFFCAVLICYRAPQRRKLDPNFGRRHEPDSTIEMDPSGSLVILDPEHGEVPTTDSGPIQDRESPASDMQMMKTTNAAKMRRDLTWSSDATKQDSTRNLRALSPPPRHKLGSGNHNRRSIKNSNSDGSNNMTWTDQTQPVGVVTVADQRSHSRSCSDSTTQSSQRSSLPPRHNGKSKMIVQTQMNHNINFKDHHTHDGGSVSSRVSKLSFTELDTQASDELSLQGFQYSTSSSSSQGAPSVVNVPKRNKSFLASAPPVRPNQKHIRSHARLSDDRNDSYTDSPTMSRFDSPRDMAEPANLPCPLPPLDEMSSTRSGEDHGVLINNVLRDLQASFSTAAFDTAGDRSYTEVKGKLTDPDKLYVE
ncbi:hypothetical protein THAOC_03502 [Thalassiosira oceanica]|uniref:Uncharacterized protein n=1 Tax=Thalassiosira oceanica TaxID=159749 RepID=K0TBC5_THAOC|nr:hypothetical protein THAOC_03502 [Thalassiosira oceanica]|mmetsp:Transcript_11072/g.25799  ORF Transcript_11072/g.25799 Transcript_11072/m.25799 type:complete len:574 (+) Transcript_11072:86-1807(+)|eukprot:EJK74800.1 hypothetical protein THAOC_03502 [Thalassiosira oceanica]